MAAEFAPGIPAGRVIQPPPTIKSPRTLEFGIHHHHADRAGEHFDLRLGDTETGHAHSWALRYLPKPGERRLAVEQVTHTIPYMDWEGRIEKGYGKGEVALARRDKAEVISSSKGHVRFNVYSGKETEEYLLRRLRPENKNWALHNVTPSRTTSVAALPSSKPSYKVLKPEKIDVKDPNTELQAKIDGAHVLYRFGETGRTPRIFSYRPTERATGVIDHTQRVPDFWQRKTPSAMKDTILRGELYAVDDKGKALPAARVGGILNANVWKSREKQEQEGRLVPVIFDVVRWKGKDVESAPYSEKKELLQQAITHAPWLQLPRTAVTPKEKAKLIKDIASGKEKSTEEGVIEWHKDKPVPKKAKFLYEKDVVVRNVFAEEGKKRKGTMAGGFEFSYTKSGPIIGRVGTGMTHSMKKDLLENPDKYVGLTARVKVQKAPAHYAPRAPVFHSFHLDQELPEGIKTAASAELVPHPKGGHSIEKLHVPPEERGKGAARKLIQELKKKASGPLWIRPRPFEDMPMSIDQLKSFYESEGFRAVDGKDNMFLEKSGSVPILFSTTKTAFNVEGLEPAINTAGKMVPFIDDSLLLYLRMKQKEKKPVGLKTAAIVTPMHFPSLLGRGLAPDVARGVGSIAKVPAKVRNFPTLAGSERVTKAYHADASPELKRLIRESPLVRSGVPEQTAYNLAYMSAKPGENLVDVVTRHTGAVAPSQLATVGAPLGMRSGVRSVSPAPAVPPPLPVRKMGSAAKVVDFQGLKIRIDRPKGFIQKGKDEKGKPWKRVYKYNYGYLPKTDGGDGDGLDVFIGPVKDDQEAYWAVQSKPDGSFDEYKVFLGFGSKAAARRAYIDHIPAERLKGITTMKLDMMKAMLGMEPIKVAMRIGFFDELEKLSKNTNLEKLAIALAGGARSIASSVPSLGKALPKAPPLVKVPVAKPSAASGIAPWDPARASYRPGSQAQKAVSFAV